MTEDEDGRLWLYREFYETQVGEAEQARRILAAEGDEQVTRFGDLAMWQARGDARSIADCYAAEGCHLQPAAKGAGSRVAGWARVHSFLAEAPACPHHRALGWETCPRLHVFTTLEHWWAEMTGLPHATSGNVEDADSRAPDHLADATRYVLAGIGAGPEFPLLGGETLAGETAAYEAGHLNVFGHEVLAQRGSYAYRPSDDDPWAVGGGDRDNDLSRRTVRTVRDLGQEGGIG